MKANIQEMCEGGIHPNSRPEGNIRREKLVVIQNGKVAKLKNKKRRNRQAVNVLEQNEDCGEMQVYLNKLQEIVPFMPKNRRLPKLEVITHVIDYIRELRQALGLPPSCSSNYDQDVSSFDSQSLVLMTHVLGNSSGKEVDDILTLAKDDDSIDKDRNQFVAST